MWNDKPLLLSEQSKTCCATVRGWESKAPQLRGRDLKHPGVLNLDGINCDCWTNMATARSEVKIHMEHVTVKWPKIIFISFHFSQNYVDGIVFFFLLFLTLI